MENLAFFVPRSDSGRIKCTIHVSGKLGFSSSAAKELQIKSSTYVKFARKSNDENDKALYMVLTDVDDGRCFRICKAGNYFYVQTKELFDEIGIDYVSKKNIFDIIPADKIERTYRLVQRIKPRKNKG